MKRPPATRVYKRRSLRSTSHIPSNESSIKHQTQPQSLDIKVTSQTHFNLHPELQPWRRALVFVSLFIGIFLSMMDSSIMATAIYTIALDFNSLAKAFWAILSYQLAYLGFAVVFARSSDFIGRRAAVLAASLFGVGGAGLYPLSIICVVETSTPKLLAMISSFIGATIAVSGVLGPVLGGVLTQYASWRWIFWINGPCGVVAIVCFTLGWPRSTTAYDLSKRKIRQFDLIGAILILAASVLVVYGLQKAGTGEYAWSSPMVLGTLVTGCLSWILLIAWQYYLHVKHRDSVASMLPFELLTNRPLLAGIISTMLTGFSFILIVVSLPLRFQIVNLRSPSSAGIHLLPLLCSVALGSFLGGTVSGKKNRVWQTFVVGCCFIVLGTGPLSTLGHGKAVETKCYGFQIIMGIGVGATISAISIMSAVSTDARTHSVAQGFASQVRLFGGSIGIAASNAIFNKTCNEKLVGILTRPEIQSLQTNAKMIDVLGTPAREAVRLAYADSFGTSLGVCVYVAAAAVLASAFTWQRKPPMVQSEVLTERAQARVHVQSRESDDVSFGVIEEKC